MSITSNANSTFLNVDNAHLRVSGDIHATSVKVGAIEIVPGYSLESTTGIGNTTPHTVEFTNTETSLVTSGDINMLHSSNNAAIKLNSNVVTEFPRSKKLIKYPRVALTGPTSGGYTASANAEESDGRAVWKLFDNTGNATAWRSEANGDYNANGAYTGSANLGSDSGGTAFADADKGDWVKIQLPHKIKLNHFTLQVRNSPTFPGGSSISYGRSEFIKNGKVWGSNDGTSWSLVHTISGTSASSDTAINAYTVTSSIYYRYFGLVITDTNATVTGLGTSLSEIELYGIPEYDPDADGVDVVVKSVPNVPNMDWLEVYYDAKDLADGTTTVNDLKPVGTAVNGTVVGNTTVSDGAFTFDGSGDYIESQNITTLSGNQVMSSSVWVKFNSWINANVDIVFSLGDRTGGNGKEYALAAYHSGTAASTNGLYVSIYGYNAITSKVIPDLNKWYHFVTTHDGSNHQIFINGVLVTSSVSNGDVSLPTSGCDLVLGGDTSLSRAQFMNGSIANFRLFNRALTSDEVWQLYAYQKEYFGHGDLSMTLKAGRLGIGTSEPSAALDVGGRNISGYTIPYAIGGDIVDFGKYKVHIFKSSGTFTVKRPGTFEVLIVAGGGGGGRHYGGGGGAGGLINLCHTFNTGDFVVTVGGGGSVNARGSNSSIISSDTRLIAFGGGCGGSYSTYPSDNMDGGSGGGGGSPTNSQQGNFDWRIMPGGNSISGQGSNGGLGFHSSGIDASGGGGGGAGEPGKRAVPSPTPGNGGDGKSFNFYSDDLVYYAGGGGGGEGAGQSGIGGAGGGGNGANGNDTTYGNFATAGEINTGGGGGGGGSASGTGGGSGGSGIVLIRYLT